MGVSVSGNRPLPIDVHFIGETLLVEKREPGIIRAPSFDLLLTFQRPSRGVTHFPALPCASALNMPKVPASASLQA